MNETRTAYRSDRVLQNAQDDAMMYMSREELETLRRRLLNAVVVIEQILGCEPSIKTRAERYR